MTKIPNLKPSDLESRSFGPAIRALDFGIYLEFGYWDLEFLSLVGRLRWARK
jgi:hypothetical protein